MSEVIGTVGSKVGTPWELVKSCPAANRTNPQEEESVAADLLVGTVDFFFIVPTGCYILLRSINSQTCW